MSLVNDMLKDLDRRKRLVAGAVPSVFIDEQVPGPGSIKSWKVIILIAAGILIGVGGGYFYFQGSQQSVIERDLSLNVQQMEDGGSSNVIENRSSADNDVSALIRQSNSGDGSVSIFAESNTAEGFALRVVSIYDFQFEIVSRDDYRIEVLLRGIRDISHYEVSIAGFSVNSTDAGRKISIVRQDAFDFLVYEESGLSNAVGKTLIIEGLIKEKAQLESSNSITAVES